MLGADGVEIQAMERTALRLLGVIVHVSHDPLPRRGSGGPFSESRLDARDAAQVGVDVPESVEPRARRVRVGINEAGKYGCPLRVEYLGACGAQSFDLVV